MRGRRKGKEKKENVEEGNAERRKREKFESYFFLLERKRGRVARVELPRE